MDDYNYLKLNTLSLYYKNQKIETTIPENSFNLTLLHKLFSPDTLSKIITSDNSFRLMKFLPKSEKNIVSNPEK